VDDPGVLVGCLYGTGLPTEVHYTYAGGGFHADPVIDRHVPGDGTVPHGVLEYCKQWEQVAARGFEGGDHRGLLLRDDFLKHATMLITNCWSETPGGPRDARCPEIGATSPTD
jgi:hypothetical protein